MGDGRAEGSSALGAGRGEGGSELQFHSYLMLMEHTCASLKVHNLKVHM